MKQIDAMTETRNSTEAPSSLWQTFKSYFCPCVLSNNSELVVRINKDQLSFIPSVHQKTSQTNHSNFHYKNKQTFDEIIVPNRNTKRKISMEFEQSQRKQSLLRKMNTVDYQFRESFQFETRNKKQELEECPVSLLTENILLPAGSKNREILIKISTTNINVKFSLLRRDVINKKKKHQKIEHNKYGNFQFNKYWDQRYVLFEKFDEGIKIDEKSWTVNPPQQVSEYISNKCNGAKIILDAFAGVGGNAIKLANVNSCVKVIANEENKKKMGFLLNNAKVYEVDSHIELVEAQFLQMQRSGIDVVVLQPNLAEISLNSHRDIKVQDFYPQLDKSILKAFTLASNMILLLPPETNIDSLATCIHRCANESKKMKDFCGVKVEKIYFGNNIKYILVCIGMLVQNQVKLNEELEFMYSKLKNSKEVYFKHKKVMKKLREDHGMLTLLNLVRESERRKKQSARSTQGRDKSCIEIFYDLVRERKLISPDKLAKIIMEQDAEYERQSSYYHSITFEDHSGAMQPVMEEEKIDQNPFNIREAELTQSEYSHYSYFSGQGKSHRSSRLMREGREKSSFGIIINRNVEGDSKQKKEEMSPITPSRKSRLQSTTENKREVQTNREQ